RNSCGGISLRSRGEAALRIAHGIGKLPIVDRASGASSADSPAVTPTGRYWQTVLLLMLVAAIGHFNRVGMSVAGAERIIPQYGLEPAQMGLVYSAFLCFYTLAMLPGGWFIDRCGARAALAVFCLGSAVFVALTGSVGLVFQTRHSV